MKDIILLEETIRMVLLRERALSDDVLENYVVGRLGRSGDPVELSIYEAALWNLLRQRKIERTKLTVEGYSYESALEELGYQKKE